MFAAILWGACYVIALAAWPLRRLTPVPRALLLTPMGVAIFAVPALFPPSPLWLKAIVVLVCPVFAIKLYDMHVDAGHWRYRALREWAAYLPNTLVLVHRLHIHEPARPRSESLRLAARGLAQVVAGTLLLAWSMRQDLGKHSFWLDHGVKLTAIYFLAFDGGFVLLNGGARLAGLRVMDFSRHPIAAITPADFWRRYNRDAGRFFRADVYVPAGGLRSPIRGIALTFLANGCLHEYLSWLMIRRIAGYQLAFFALQGLAVAATYRWKPWGIPALLAWMGTLAFMFVTSALFFLNGNEFVAWYSRTPDLFRH